MSDADRIGKHRPVVAPEIPAKQDRHPFRAHARVCGSEQVTRPPGNPPRSPRQPASPVRIRPAAAARPRGRRRPRRRAGAPGVPGEAVAIRVGGVLFPESVRSRATRCDTDRVPAVQNTPPLESLHHEPRQVPVIEMSSGSARSRRGGGRDGKLRQFSSRSCLSPWNRPASMRMRALPVSRR